MKKTLYYGSSASRETPQQPTWNWFMAGVIVTLLAIILYLVW